MADRYSSTKNTLLIATALAVAYVIAGRLALLLALPPGFASPIWPAAGLALAAVYLWGWRVWPGVFVGAFLTNAPSDVDTSSIEMVVDALWLPFVLGIGAPVQAVVGGLALKRIFGDRSDLDSLRDVSVFFAVGGALSCLIGATLSNTTLLLAGAVEPAGLIASWSTWWVGDVIGVFVGAPLVLIAWARPREMWRGRAVSVGISLAIMVALTAVLFFVVTRWERDRIQLAFNQRTLTLAESAHLEFEIDRDALRAIERLFASSDRVDRDEFGIFVANTVMRRKGIQALSWLPMVTSADRQRFEVAAREEGLENFEISERNDAGALVRATTRPVYFPVFYINPVAGNEAAIGFDIASNPTRRAALDQSRDTGAQTATGRIRLVQETGQSFGILIIQPIFRQDGANASIESRRRNLVGYASGVFRINDMLGELVETLRAENIDVWLYDRSAAADLQLLHGPTDASGKVAERSLVGLGPEAMVTYDMAGRKWELRFVATPEYRAIHQSWTVWAVLVGAFLFAGGFSGFLLAITGRTARIEQVVNERTLEIQSQSNQLTTIVNAISQGLTVIAPDRRLASWNDQYVELFGMPEDRLEVGMTLEELNRVAIEAGVVSETEAEKFMSTFGSVHQDNAPRRIEINLVDGRIIDLRREVTSTQPSPILRTRKQMRLRWPIGPRNLRRPTPRWRTSRTFSKATRTAYRQSSTISRKD